MSGSRGPVREQRLSLSPATVGRLIQWQGRAVAGGLTKPTYSELLDALVAEAQRTGVDPIDLIAAAPSEGTAA